MKKSVSFLLGIVLACLLSVSAFAAQSPSGNNSWSEYTPIIATPEPRGILTPDIVAEPGDPSSAQSNASEKPAIMPEYGKKPSSNTGDAGNALNREAEGEAVEELDGDLFELIVRETVTEPDAPEVVESVEEDPVKDSIPPEKMHYLPVDAAVKNGQTTNQILQAVISKADAENRSIVSAIVIIADADVAGKIGTQENGEDRYVAFTFLPEAIGITESDLDTLLVFVNGHPVALVRNPDGTISIKLAEWGLVTFEIAVR